jgi:hypothetical protein
MAVAVPGNSPQNTLTAARNRKRIIAGRKTIDASAKKKRTVS